jgi:DNA-binding MarR family transcriptional regulator
MDDTLHLFQDIAAQFIQVMNKYSALEKRPIDFGTDELLYPSEIHMIEAIGKGRGMNITELGGMLGVTKGAVSQKVARLVRKGLVQKIKAPSSEKEVLLKLTEKGWIAFEGHEKFHMGLYVDFIKYIEDFSSDEMKRFSEILKKLEDHIEGYGKNRK